MFLLKELIIYFEVAFQKNGSSSLKTKIQSTQKPLRTLFFVAFFAAVYKLTIVSLDLIKVKGVIIVTIVEPPGSFDNV